MPIMDHKKLGKLIKKSLNGDERAFQMFYECTAKFQYYRILQMIDNRSEADDALQEAYLLLYQRLDRIGDPASAVAYLNKLSYHVCLNHHKTTSRRQRRMSGLDMVEGLPDQKGDPQELLLKADTSSQIQKAIMALPPQECDVLMLRYLQKLTLKETADAMNISFSKVRRLQQSAKDLLKKELNRKGLMALFPLLPAAGKNLGEIIESQITIPAPNLQASRTANISAPNPSTAHFSSYLVKSVAGAAGAGVLVSGAVSYISPPPGIEDIQIPAVYSKAPADLYVTVKSRMPVASCDIRFKGRSLPGSAGKEDRYHFAIGENGEYTVIVKNNSGKTASEKIRVDCFDEVHPKAVSVQLKEGRFLVKLYDGESGIDEDSIYYLTDSGEKVYPEIIDIQSMTALFPAKDGESTLYFSDKSGNESSARLNY